MKKLIAVSILLAALGCSKTEPPKASSPPEPAPVAHAITGQVKETVNAAGYTYMRVETGKDESWVAVRETDVKVGDEVTVVPQVTLAEFESPTLQRKFDSIVFAAMPEGRAAGTTATAPPTQMPAGHPVVGGGMSPAHPMSSGTAEVGDVTVKKLPGGKTVAQAWAERAELADQTVAIRGKVVKFRAHIMGTNWVHIRDGSGSEAAGDHDITVTTDGTAAAGDVVVVSGTLRKDRDFGAGYVYPVMIENATIKKQPS